MENPAFKEAGFFLSAFAEAHPDVSGVRMRITRRSPIRRRRVKLSDIIGEKLGIP